MYAKPVSSAVLSRENNNKRSVVLISFHRFMISAIFKLTLQSKGYASLQQCRNHASADIFFFVLLVAAL